MFDFDAILLEKLKKINPSWLRSFLIYILKKIFHAKEINEFYIKNKDENSLDFIKNVLDYFEIKFEVSKEELENIPKTSKVIVVANHPLGALDALALVLMLKQIRNDVKITASEILSLIDPIRDILIPVDNINKKSKRVEIQNIYKLLNENGLVIFFPSGEVSRMHFFKVHDTKWQNGFLKFAKKTNAPILPIHIKARNSWLFYFVSFIKKDLATLLLPHEMFKQKNKTIKFKIGKIIPFKNIKDLPINGNQTTSLLRKHLYRVGKNKKEIIKTYSPIPQPISKNIIHQAILKNEQIGLTIDKKSIYLLNSQKNEDVLKEIGRLREISFRMVEEGSGNALDLDKYDDYYKHLVLYHEEEKEIVGSYRLGIYQNIKKNYSIKGLYTSNFYNFSKNFLAYIENSVELGRSFVNPKYWNSMALDYLWQGIGAYLHKNPQIKYLFGAVSLSDSYPRFAKVLIIYYYNYYYSSKTKLVTAKNPFIIFPDEIQKVEKIFTLNSKEEDLKILKQTLETMGLSIPVLYKQYTNVCEDDGILFLSFSIDEDFGNCVDSLIIVDISKIKENKKARYFK